jgi:hypothetical protein
MLDSRTAFAAPTHEVCEASYKGTWEIEVKRFLLVSLLSVLSTVSVVSAKADEGAPGVTKGAMLFSADGGRLGTVYRVMGDGSAQIIFESRMVTIPANTLSSKDGKLTTSLKKPEVMSLK